MIKKTYNTKFDNAINNINIVLKNNNKNLNSSKDNLRVNDFVNNSYLYNSNKINNSFINNDANIVNFKNINDNFNNNINNDFNPFNNLINFSNNEKNYSNIKNQNIFGCPLFWDFNQQEPLNNAGFLLNKMNNGINIDMTRPSSDIDLGIKNKNSKIHIKEEELFSEKEDYSKIYNYKNINDGSYINDKTNMNFIPTYNFLEKKQVFSNNYNLIFNEPNEAKNFIKFVEEHLNKNYVI